MSHTVGAQTTNYTWDVNSGLPVVLQDGTSTYVYGLDLISATDSGGAQTYFLYDGLGSTRGLTDGSGATTATYSYDVFGGIRSQTGTSSNYWQFTGEQRDGGEGLDYLRARYYDPGTGRFLSRDPLPSGNLYAYATSNPVNFTDPSGLWPCPGCDWLTDKLGDAGECVRNGFDCVPKVLVRPFTEGPLYQRVLNTLDVLPIAPVCALVGGAVAGPGGSVAGGIVCELAEDAVAVINLTTTQWNILKSECSWDRKVGATAINIFVNGAVDYYDEYLVGPAKSLEYVVDYGSIVGVNELMNCVKRVNDPKE